MELRAAVVQSYRFSRSKNGHDYVLILFSLLDYGGRESIQVPWRGYFTPKAISRTVEVLRVLGWKGYDISRGLGSKGQKCLLELVPSIWQNYTSPKVVGARPYEETRQHTYLHADRVYKDSEVAKWVAPYFERCASELRKHGQLDNDPGDDEEDWRDGGLGNRDDPLW